MSLCEGVIAYSSGPDANFTGWNDESIGTPIASGAAFYLSIEDTAWNSTTNNTQVAGWSLTFLPRPGNSLASPFGNNQNTITGGANAGVNGSFPLVNGTPNEKIKNGGNWDWVFMVQMSVGGVIHCFASDPEMEVGT